MLTTILSIIGSIVQVILNWTSSARDKTLIALGATKQSEKDLEGRIDAIKEANKIRNEADASIARDPDSVLRDDDGFRRNDE
jgi:hypothetical protein